VNNALTLAGVSTFNLADLGGTTTGTYTLLDYAGSPLADLSNFTIGTTIPGFTATLVNDTANTSVDLQLSPGGPTNASWAVDADGNWSVGGNWAGSNAPNAAGAVATFGTVITAPRTVTVDSPQTTGAIVFDNANKYTVAGTSTLTLQASSGAAS